MGPFRAIQKRKAAMIVTQTPMSLLLMFMRHQQSRIQNAKENRDPVWSMKKMQSYISSLFLDCTAPKDFLVRLVPGENDEDVPILYIYDGSNRLNAIFRFMNNEFPIRIATEYVYYIELPPVDKDAFDNIDCQFQQLINCPIPYACEIAEKRNEGTTMSIGEKVTLLRRHGTPRSAVLDALMNSAPYMTGIPDDRGAGTKMVAQLIQAIEVKHGVTDPSFKLSEYHMEPMSNFFKCSDEVIHIDCDQLTTAFLQIGSTCFPDGTIPAEIKSTIDAGVESKSAPQKACFFYCSVISLLIKHVRFGQEITNEALQESVAVFVNKPKEWKETNTYKKLSMGIVAINGTF